MAVKLASEVWRDYVTDGLPSSAPHDPDKADIRAWATNQETLINAVANGGKIYQNKAAMDADNAPAVNTAAIILNDSTAANNGLYQKTSAAGTGSGTWVKRSDSVPGFQFIYAADVGAGTANAIVATSSLPIPTTAGAVLVSFNIFETNTASPVTVAFNGGTALTIKTNSGNDVVAGGLVEGMMVVGVVGASNTFRLLSDQASLALFTQTEALINDFGDFQDAKDAAVAASATAVEAADDAQTALAAVTLVAASKGYYASVAAGEAAVANGETFWVISGDEGEFYLKTAGVASAIANARFPLSSFISEVLADVNALREDESIGVATPVTGLTLGAATYVLANPTTYAGILKEVRAFCLNAGTVKVRIFSRSGNDFTQVGSDINFAVTAGLKTLNPNIVVAAGHYIGFYAAANVLARTSTTDVGYYNGTGDVTTFTDSSLTTTFRLEFGVTVSSLRFNGADIAAALATTAALNAANTERQIIGVPQTPVTGSALSAGTVVLLSPVTRAGRVRTFAVWSVAAVTFKVRRFRLVNGTFTQVGSDVNCVSAIGLNTFTLDIAVDPGDYLGFYSPTNGVSRPTERQYDGGYYYTASDATSVSATNAPSTTLAIQARFEIEQIGEPSKLITIQNSARVVVIGDSHSEGASSLRGKHWPARLSQSCDYQFANFGKSGDTATENVARIRNGTKTLGDQRYEEREADLAFIYIGQNDAATAMTVADFQNDLRQLVELARGMGAEPVIIPEHTRTPMSGFVAEGWQTIYKAAADTLGAHFVNIVPNCRIVDRGTRYGGFYDSTHLGTRTNFQIVDPLREFMDRLPPPRQSIKVFFPRSTPAAIADVYFDTYAERAERWREIGIGQIALTDPLKVDELNTVNWTTGITTHTNQYTELAVGDTIASTPDYLLLEIVFPAIAKYIDRAELVLTGCTGATVYCRDVMDAIADGSPTGAWRKLGMNASGVVPLSQRVLDRGMRGDKLSVLIYLAGGFSAFGAPVVRWWGEESKPPRAVPPPRAVSLGAELLAATDLGSLTGWTVVGSLTAGAPADAMTPLGSTGRVSLTASNYVTQAVTWSADNDRDREVEISLWCRNFPAIEVSSSPAGNLTEASHDYRTVEILVTTAAGTAVHGVPFVGLWWRQVTIRTLASLGTTGFTVGFRAQSGTIEAARASAKLVTG